MQDLLAQTLFKEKFVSLTIERGKEEKRENKRKLKRNEIKRQKQPEL